MQNTESFCQGQGLIDIESRIKAFKLEYLRDILFENHMCSPFFQSFVLQYRGDKLYPDLIQYDDVVLININLPAYYRSIVKVWRTFEKKRILDQMTVADILSETLFEPENKDNYVFFHMLVDLEKGRWKTNDELYQELNIIKSRRVFEHFIIKIKNLIPVEWVGKMELFFEHKIELGKRQIFDYMIVFEDKTVYLSDTKKRVFYLSILTFSAGKSVKRPSKWETWLLGRDFDM